MDWQKYLPWIIGAAVILFVLSRLKSRTVLAPQTQIVETPQTDPYIGARITAFTSLADLASDIAAQDTVKALGLAREETARVVSSGAQETERLRINTGLTVANRSFDTDISLAEITARVQQAIANLNLFSRNQDAEIQRSAIERYYSSRNLQNIVGSVSGALSTIFGNRSGGGSIFRGTPPTFPGATF